MKVVFLICFTILSFSVSSQSKFVKNSYVASIMPNKLLNQLNDLVYFWETGEIIVSADFVKSHYIKSITEKKYFPFENSTGKPDDTTFKITYFNKKGFPTKIEMYKNEKYIDQSCEFEYDDNNNLTMFCAYDNFWMIEHRNYRTEIIIKNEFNRNLLVHQNIRCIYSTYKYNKRLIDCDEISFFHDITYFQDDFINIVTVNNKFDTLIRKAHVDMLYKYPSELYNENHNFSLMNKDTLLCYFFSKSDLWSFKRVFNKEYDSLGYLIKMNATVFKENSLENYDSLKYYYMNSMDTISEICPFFSVNVVTKGTSSISNPDSTKIFPKYTSDTINVQYQFYYMDNINHSNSTKTILGYYLYNDKGEKIDQNERNSSYCKNFYNENGLIDKQIFTLSPFWEKQEGNKQRYRYWHSDICTLFKYEYY